jgi:phosphomannomutase
VVAEEVRRAGGLPRRERRGGTAMKKVLAESHGVFAGDLEGRYYFREHAYCESALLAFASVLRLVAAAGTTLDDLIAPLRRYAQSGERTYPFENVAETFRRLAERYGDGEMDDLDGLTVEYPDWWFNIRPAATAALLHLNVEADNADLLATKLAELSSLIGATAVVVSGKT